MDWSEWRFEVEGGHCTYKNRDVKQKQF